MAWILASFLGSVCKIVANIGFKEYILLRDGKEEIMNLRRTVRVAMGKLKDAETKQVDSHVIRERLKELKQVLFEAEDVLDEIATDEALEKRDAEDGTSRPPKVRKLNFFGVDISSSSRAIAHRVKGINKKLDDILNDKDMLELHVSNETSGSVMGTIFRRPPPDTSSLLPKEARIIGRDDEMRELEELLLEHYAEGTVAATSDNYKNVHVISVVGMGGVGKTTLVKHAYNRLAVTEYFQLRMWVCVSNYFDVKRVTREIMNAAASSSADTSNWDAAQKSLQGKLEGKRFLLVLDDVWEEDPSKWEDLCTPLMYGGKGSKIIMTTRSQKVSNITKGIPILLEDLSSKDLWSIFQTYAFDDHDPDKHTQLVIVGKQIVDNLKGSPLAAKTIGRLLNANLDVGHWRNILSSKAWVSPDSEDSILPILKLSYDHLPGHLKQCFALCSLFPEDHQFDKDELVQLWTAHQLIHIREGFSHVESEGNVYLDKLVHMSLFEKYTDNDDQERFVMHDLIHNLADSVSKDDCLRLEDNQQNGTSSETIRHVSIASDRFDLALEIEQLCKKYKNMRTLLFLCGCKFQLDPYLDNIFMKLQRLRVLRLSKCGIEELPASIGTLKHLRLLDLSNNLISKLPESLCKLRNLQVLKLRRCRRLRALPRNTSALVNLRHLELDTEIASCVPGLGKLTALQELIVNGSKVGELADMGMLKELQIWGLEGVARQEEAVRARLEAKEHLELLELKWASYNRPRGHSVEEEEEVVDALKPVNGIRQLSVISYEGARPPKWMGDPAWVSTSLLVEVKLFNCTNWEVLPPLGQLPGLKFLQISGMSGVRRIGPEFFFSCCCDDGEGGVKLAPGFPSLEELEFREMPEWEEWESPVVLLDQQQQQQPLLFPRLRKLRLYDCEKLRELPPLPPTLTTLRLEKMGLTRLPGWMERCSDDDIGRDEVMMPASTSTSSSSPSLLSTLEIRSCPNITSLGDGLLQRPLRMLKKLRIKDCEELASLPAGGVFRQLDSLEELEVTDCPKLVLWRVPSAATEEDAQQLPSSLKFVRLEKLLTGGLQLLLGGGGLQKLTSLTSLDVDVSSSDMTLAGLISSTSLTHLAIRGRDDDDGGGALMSTCLQGLIITYNSLKSLSIFNCWAITTLSSSEEVLRRLSALQSLSIEDCGELRSLGAAAGLVSLKSLTIRNCPKLLHLVEEEGGAAAAVMSSPPVIIPSSSPVVVVPKKIISLKTLWAVSCSPKQIATWLRQVSSLQVLYIEDCPQLRCFGAGDDDGDTINGGDLDLEGGLLDLAPSLRVLCLFLCYNLSSLPSKLRSLSRLESLRIGNCPKIQRLPSAGLPQTLKELAIIGCPELEQRCREEGCPDWPLLSHIPRVHIGH